MPYPLNNATTSIDYSDRNTLVLTTPRPIMSMIVTGAAIFYKFSAIKGLQQSDQYAQEVFVPPGRYYFDVADLPPNTDAFSKLAVRSALATAPAQVSAS